MSTDGIAMVLRIFARAGGSVAPTGTASAHATPSSATLDDWITDLFEQHRTALYRYLVATFGRPADAEEVTQDAFLRLYRFVREGGTVENARAWLFRAAHNLALDRLDRVRWQATGDDEWWDLLVQRVPDADPSPEQMAIRQQREARFHHALQQLSIQQRRCLLLRLEGLRHREIADTLGVSMATVAQALRRGLQRLMRDRDD